MNQHDSPKDDAEAPPVMGTWRRVYWFVALFFFAEVALFYVFTRYYS